MLQYGIGSIINKNTGKTYIFKSNNINKRLEDYRLQLVANCHHNKELQNDWNALTSKDFIFEVKEILEKDDELMDKTLDKYLNNTANIYKDIKNPKISLKPFKYELKILYKELYSLIGETHINPMFSNKLATHNIGENFYAQIRTDAENLIEKSQVKIGGVEELLDELIDEISKDKEAEDKLINYLLSIIGIDALNPKFKSKLNTKGLDYNIGFKIKEDILNLIKSHEIIEFEIIDSKIDEMLEIEIINANKIKQSLFKELHSIIDSSDFKSKLKLSNIPEDFRNELSSKYEDKIKTYAIRKGFDFENNINQDILNEKMKDLLNKLDDIFDDADFHYKLNKFLLNKDDANEIKSNLVKFIESSELNYLINLDNNDLKNKVDDCILEKSNNIKTDIFELRKNLLADLESIDDSYLSKIDLADLSKDDVDIVKTKLEDIIINDEIMDYTFSYKIDELRSLEKTTVKIAFKLLISFEIEQHEKKLDKLRDELKIDLSKLCSKDSDSFINIKLEEYDLPQSSVDTIVEKIKDMIGSNEIYNESFNSKLEELSYFKGNNLKKLIIDVLKEFKETIDIELASLYKITGNDPLSNSFKSSLHMRGLNANAGRKIISQVENSIIYGNINTNLELYIENCLNQLESVKNKSSQLLEDNVGHDAHNSSFVNKLTKNNLDPNINGMHIKDNMDELIQSGEVNPKNFDYILNREINHEISQKNNRLLNDVDCIIGLDEINDSFLYKINKFYLNKYDAINIRFEIIEAINKNEIEEFLISDKINQLVQEKGNIRMHDLLIKKVRDIIGYDSINYEFSQIMLSHDLDEFDAQKIKDNIIDGINGGRVNCDNLNDSINREMYLLDSSNVKKELKKLSSNQLDLLLKKYSLSGFTLFKSAKINKLVDNVKLSNLKRDLANFGFSRYKVKYDTSFDDEFKFCNYCGSKNEFDAIFCDNCGKKLN